MTLEQQVTSLKLSKRLKELGVEQESLFSWVKPKEAKNWVCWYYRELCSKEVKNWDDVSAFTVAELGEMFNFHLSLQKGEKHWYVRFWWGDYPDLLKNMGGDRTNWYETGDKNPANALAQMLIYLLENKLITQ